VSNIEAMDREMSAAGYRLGQAHDFLWTQLFRVYDPGPARDGAAAR
jgi:hypothetical protein